MSVVKLYPQGFYVEQLTEIKRLQTLAESLWPIESHIDLVRIGREGDGGYLVPDDFEGLTVCFSPGVETNSSFESSLNAIAGIESHLADFSVDGPPAGFKPKSFLKKFLGPNLDERHITLEKWVLSTDDWSLPGDFLLQCDIEGGEYLTLLAVPDYVLTRFRIVVLEIHHVERWANPGYFELVESFFARLLDNYFVMHNHPNNHGCILDINGFIVPQAFELTFIRKDRTIPNGYRQDFPHFLDRPCLAERSELVLPKNWIGAS